MEGGGRGTAEGILFLLMENPAKVRTKFTHSSILHATTIKLKVIT